MNLKKISKAEKRELKLSPLRRLRINLKEQGMTLEGFLEICYKCDLNPLPMLRKRGINIKYYKDTSYCDVSVHHEGERIVLTYPDFETNWNEWYRFNNRYYELMSLADEQRTQKCGLNRPHRVVRRKKYGIN